MDDTASAARESADSFDRLEISARAAGRAMQAAFAAAEADGRKLEDVLRSVGSRLGEMLLQAGGQTASNLLSGGLSAALGGLASGALGNAAAASSDALTAPAAGGQPVRALSVVMNVSTPDADSFRRGEAQVSAALARAVARGSRAM
ncbi:MAG: hypothetical protein ACRCTI_01710 [Beijerinckiaceae bacterium]